MRKRPITRDEVRMIHYYEVRPAYINDPSRFAYLAGRSHQLTVPMLKANELAVRSAFTAKRYGPEPGINILATRRLNTQQLAGTSV